LNRLKFYIKKDRERKRERGGKRTKSRELIAAMLFIENHGKNCEIS